MNSEITKIDPLERGLALLEAENRKFNNHWLWRQLGCKPEEFFTAFKKYLAKMQIPQQQWEVTLQRVREANRIRSKESAVTFNPLHLKLLHGITV